MTTNAELDAALKNLPGYRGAVGVDKLGQALKSGESMIINLQESTEAGSHWVCASRQAPGFALYLDPYGAPPDNRVLNWLRRSGAMPLFSNTQYQSDRSDLCGWYCAFWLTELDKNSDVYRTMYSLLDTHPSDRNERIIRELRDEIKSKNTMSGKGGKATLATPKAKTKSKAKAASVEAFCVQCKTKQVIKDPHECVTKNGRRMLKGTDAHGHKVSRILGMAQSGCGLYLH